MLFKECFRIEQRKSCYFNSDFRHTPSVPKPVQKIGYPYHKLLPLCVPAIPAMNWLVVFGCCHCCGHEWHKSTSYLHDCLTESPTTCSRPEMPFTSVTLSGVAQSVQCLTTDWTTGRSRFDPQQRQDNFPIASVSRPTLRPTQPPVQWVPWVIYHG
jgi:hypothetical protein